MILPPVSGGMAYTEASDGDVRNDTDARHAVSRSLGVPSSWAMARQIHGSTVRKVDRPGVAGECDALWTTEPGLPVAVFDRLYDRSLALLTDLYQLTMAHGFWKLGHARREASEQELLSNQSQDCSQ